MNPSTASNALVFSRIGLAIAGLAAMSCLADSPTQQCTAQAPTHTLSLRDPTGNELRLGLLPGCGWKYMADAATAPLDDLMAVFIDGPTGYTYAWIRDAGWKFVGRLTDEPR